MKHDFCSFSFGLLLPQATLKRLSPASSDWSRILLPSHNPSFWSLFHFWTLICSDSIRDIVPLVLLSPLRSQIYSPKLSNKYKLYFYAGSGKSLNSDWQTCITAALKQHQRWYLDIIELGALGLLLSHTGSVLPLSPATWSLSVQQAQQIPALSDAHCFPPDLYVLASSGHLTKGCTVTLNAAEKWCRFNGQDSACLPPMYFYENYIAYIETPAVRDWCIMTCYIMFRRFFLKLS